MLPRRGAHGSQCLVATRCKTRPQDCCSSSCGCDCRCRCMRPPALLLPFLLLLQVCGPLPGGHLEQGGFWDASDGGSGRTRHCGCSAVCRSPSLAACVLPVRQRTACGGGAVVVEWWGGGRRSASGWYTYKLCLQSFDYNIDMEAGRMRLRLPDSFGFRSARTPSTAPWW